MAEKHTPFAVLGIRDFRYFISARLFMTLAIQIQAVAVGWQVYQITRDPLSLGLIGLSEAIPAISVSLYAGHLADVSDRRRIILSCAVLLMLCAITLFSFSEVLPTVLSTYGAIPIYSVIFVSGIARGFLSPANFSFMPQLVPRELFTNAVTWNSTIWEAAAVGGPALGGLFVDMAGLSFTFFAVICLVVAGVTAYALVDRKPIPDGTGKQDMFSNIREGLQFVFRHPLILSAISLDLFAVLFGGAVALLPVFAAEILHAGPNGFGLLRAAPAAGALVMALWLSYRPVRLRPGKVLLWCVAGFGVCMIAFGLSKELWLSIAILSLSGAFDCVSVIIRGVLIQTQTPDHMKGRVAAINSMFIGSSNEIGAFESGVAARLLGVVPSVIFGGGMTLLTTAVTAWKSEKLRSLRILR